jgi:hypothetical protein
MRIYSLAGFLVVSKESPPEGITLSGHYIPAGTIMAVSINLICSMNCGNFMFMFLL